MPPQPSMSHNRPHAEASLMAAEPAIGTWRSEIDVRAAPEHVLATLTDPDACAAWSPVGFEVDGLDSSRLRTGTKVAVSGRLAGRPVRFCVEVFRADSDRLVLRAAGPVEMKALYVVRPVADGSRVDAAISVHRAPGRRGGLAAHAACILLGAGALNRTLARVAREAERRHSSSRRSRRRERLAADTAKAA